MAIANNHGGFIEVQSIENSGSQFTGSAAGLPIRAGNVKPCSTVASRQHLPLGAPSYLRLIYISLLIFDLLAWQ